MNDYELVKPRKYIKGQLLEATSLTKASDTLVAKWQAQAENMAENAGYELLQSHVVIVNDYQVKRRALFQAPDGTKYYSTGGAFKLYNPNSALEA